MSKCSKIHYLENLSQTSTQSRTSNTFPDSPMLWIQQQYVSMPSTVPSISHNGPATLFCSACKDAPVIASNAGRIRYCSAECQKKHWTIHKTACRNLSDRKKLYRVMEISQQLFYLCREWQWSMIDLKRVQK